MIAYSNIYILQQHRHLLETPVTEPVFSEQLVVLQAKLALSGDHHQRCSRAAQVSFRVQIGQQCLNSYIDLCRM